MKNNQLEKLKVPGYTLLLPMSWELHGYARVVVYVKNTLDYIRVEEIENEHLQSIWIRGGFKNSKHGYYCNGYREHKSNVGGSLNNQKYKLEIFLNQWEQALCHGNPSEPNDIFVLCDMNLNSYQDVWLNPDYHLYSLSQLVQHVCNTNNLSQLVKDITRAQYNSVANKTDLSCIDHIYSNVKFKCSKPEVLSFGGSDHDIIGIIRLQKEPPQPAQTVRKRSYKTFVKQNFLDELSSVDWTDVLTCVDLDNAVAIFTSKFKNVLNKHAPWVIFQRRKIFSPWITKQTKDLMEERDKWKEKAKQCAQNNRNVFSCPGEVQAWKQCAYFRNKVNNSKKMMSIGLRKAK